MGEIFMDWRFQVKPCTKFWTSFTKVYQLYICTYTCTYICWFLFLIYVIKTWNFSYIMSKCGSFLPQNFIIYGFQVFCILIFSLAFWFVGHVIHNISRCKCYTYYINVYGVHLAGELWGNVYIISMVDMAVMSWWCVVYTAAVCSSSVWGGLTSPWSHIHYYVCIHGNAG